MKESDRPSPPDDLEPELYAVLEALGELDVETLRTVADYTDELASWAASDAPHESGSESESESPATDEIPFPDDVPKRASATVTDVDGSEYYYFQWRDGDKIRSKTVQR